MPSKLTSLLVACAALLAASGAALAQEPTPSHVAAARDLVMASGAYGTIERVMPEIVEEIRRQGVTRPDMSKALGEVLTAMQPELDKQRDLGVTEAAKVYTKYMTEQELKDVTAFFKSPVGAKYIKVQPDVTDDLINVVTSWSQGAAEYTQTRVHAEMQKRGFQMQ